jgi:transcriptional regulator with XRE-family HTH domain
MTAADRCGFSQSKLSKIETGQFLPSNEDLGKLLGVLGADEATTARLLDVRSTLAGELESWRLLHLSGFDKNQARLESIEQRVDRILVFQTSVVPGLLQTYAYAEAVIARATHRPAAESEVQARLGRRKILDDTSKRFSFLIAESALRWRYAERSTHHEQWISLLRDSERPNVDVRVLPFGSRPIELPLHSFSIFGEELVTVELLNSQASFRDGDVRSYLDAFQRLSLRSKPLLSLASELSDYFEVTT